MVVVELTEEQRSMQVEHGGVDCTDTPGLLKLQVQLTAVPTAVLPCGAGVKARQAGWSLPAVMLLQGSSCSMLRR